MRTRSRSKQGLTAGVLTGLLALTGCGGVEDLPTSTASTPTFTSHTGADTWRATFGVTPGGVGDFVNYSSTEELASACKDVVVKGEVGEIRDGRQLGRFDDTFPDIKTVVIPVRITTVAKGDVRPGDLVHISQMTSDGVDASTWQQALPVGTPLVAYLTRTTDEHVGEGTGIDVKDFRAGLPDGADLYVSSPQGFALEDGDSALYFPFTDVKRPGTLNDALPGGPALGIDPPPDGVSHVPEYCRTT